MGLACGDDLAETYRRAVAGDPQTAFGGAISFNRTVTEAAAREIAEVFFEDLIAPDYTPEALAVLQKKRDLRIMSTGYQPERPGELEAGDIESVAEGVLRQLGAAPVVARAATSAICSADGCRSLTSLTSSSSSSPFALVASR